jgi:protein-tyrosine phosphatase
MTLYLCGKFCDLYEIGENAGFEVFCLPIPDECAPDMEEMKKRAKGIRYKVKGKERGMYWVQIVSR